jgi:hypothetical protein
VAPGRIATIAVSSDTAVTAGLRRGCFAWLASRVASEAKRQSRPARVFVLAAAISRLDWHVIRLAGASHRRRSSLAPEMRGHTYPGMRDGQ